MPQALLTTPNSANFRGAEAGTKNPILGIVSPLHEAITALLKNKYPRKTWGFLANLVNISDRVAKHRLANTRSYTIEELQLMLQSEDGFEILQILMADAEPRWWWWAKRVMATAERRRLAAELEQEILQLETSRPPDANGRRRLKGDLDARTTLNKKFAAAETALGVLHQDINRASDRTVASAQGRRR